MNRVVFSTVVVVLSPLIPAIAAADLIEVRVEGEIAGLRIQGLPLRTSLRPGVAIWFSYSYPDALIERGINNGGNTTYELNEPVKWQAGDYAAEATGSIVVSRDRFRVFTDSAEIPGFSFMDSPITGKAEMRFGQSLTSHYLPDHLPPFEGIQEPRIELLFRPTVSHGGYSEVGSFFSTIVEHRIQSGDSNRDGRFDQLDLVQVLQAAVYLTGEPALWNTGDWNGDGVFNQEDIIEAIPNYQSGDAAAIAPVPEPATLAILVAAVILAISPTTRLPRRKGSSP